MLRLSEMYVSSQGEGTRTGELTQFVRFAGCNMRCPGWPCDTQHAIVPSIWMKESVKISSTDLFDKVTQAVRDTGATNICLTGGEPFLQPFKDLEELVMACVEEGLTVEAFSNGSFVYPRWALHNVHFMMDWKLEGSGEAQHKREERLRNAHSLKPTDGIKFVVKDGDDLLEAIDLTHGELARVNASLWVGSAWAHISEADIVDFIIEHKMPWKLNVQVHKYVWPAEARGV